MTTTSERVIGWHQHHPACNAFCRGNTHSSLIWCEREESDADLAETFAHDLARALNVTYIEHRRAYEAVRPPAEWKTLEIVDGRGRVIPTATNTVAYLVTWQVDE